MEFQIVRADVSDAEAIAAVIQTCYEQMEHKEWYVPDDAEYMRKLLSVADESDCAVAFSATGKEESCCGSIRGIAYKAIVAENENAPSLCQADFQYEGRECSTLAGIFVVAFPGDSPKSMGWDIGFDAAKCRQMAHMDTAAVLPEYRGHQLQYRMMQTAEQELRRRGFRYLAATVHPENHASKNTMLRQGYQLMITKEKYGGHLRDVMLKVLD